ncbi:unnamed protein product [Brassica rapa]|uniref:Uncharacterized protein n=1 Tax=Brassica campestris TaxID=3711 RepID=A0A3P5YI23_BRACM|nr:unnamed protein product [Brassica rapa]VDC61060.1 unnamed protein product [Brassica rapa]
MCYGAHLLRCRLWFPIPEITVQALECFQLSIRKLSPGSLQHLIGIMVLSFEQGMTLSANYLEAFLFLQDTGLPLTYCFKPRPHMLIILFLHIPRTGSSFEIFFVVLHSIGAISPRDELAQRSSIIDPSSASLRKWYQSNFFALLHLMFDQPLAGIEYAR